MTGGSLHLWVVLQIGLEKLSSTLMRVFFAIMGHKVCFCVIKAEMTTPAVFVQGFI